MDTYIDIFRPVLCEIPYPRAISNCLEHINKIEDSRVIAKRLVVPITSKSVG